MSRRHTRPQRSGTAPSAERFRVRSPVAGGAGAGQLGASMAEFLVVAPALLFLGLGTLQAGLIYHANTILQYATFEAARTGATHHALPDPMRHELAVRLAPLVGGDGSDAAAVSAIARSVAEMASPVTADGRPRPPTRLAVLNPTPAAFEDWGVTDPVAGRVVIPNSHLRHRLVERGAGPSGLTLRDANLLKIEVTHGVELVVPVVGPVLSRALALFDPANAEWYAADRLPLKAVATVRMQSDAWQAGEGEGVSVAPAGEPGRDAETPGTVVPGGEAADGGGHVPAVGPGRMGARAVHPNRPTSPATARRRTRDRRPNGLRPEPRERAGRRGRGRTRRTDRRARSPRRPGLRSGPRSCSRLSLPVPPRRTAIRA